MGDVIKLEDYKKHKLRQQPVCKRCGLWQDDYSNCESCSNNPYAKHEQRMNVLDEYTFENLALLMASLPSSTPFVEIKGNAYLGYKYYDLNGEMNRDYTDTLVDACNTDGDEIDSVDYAITLMTAVNPKEIIFHLDEQDHPDTLNTLKEIFKNRVKVINDGTGDTGEDE